MILKFNTLKHLKVKSHLIKPLSNNFLDKKLFYQTNGQLASYFICFFQMELIHLMSLRNQNKKGLKLCLKLKKLVSLLNYFPQMVFPNIPKKLKKLYQDFYKLILKKDGILKKLYCILYLKKH